MAEYRFVLVSPAGNTYTTNEPAVANDLIYDKGYSLRDEGVRISQTTTADEPVEVVLK